ncbi:MAG: hypothetical protein ABH950_03315 [Candidatus Altiarchaeota archaeon]
MGNHLRGRRQFQSPSGDVRSKVLRDFPMLRGESSALTLPEKVGFKPVDEGVKKSTMQGGGELIEGQWGAGFNIGGVGVGIELISQSRFREDADKPKSWIEDHYIMRFRFNPREARGENGIDYELSTSVTWDDRPDQDSKRSRTIWASVYSNKGETEQNVVDNGMGKDTLLKSFRDSVPQMIVELADKSTLELPESKEGGEVGELFGKMLSSMKKAFGAEMMDPNEL